MPDETRSPSASDNGAPDAETRWAAPAARVEVTVSSPPPQPVPAMIGRYRILRLLAEGGMGAVYEAEQEHPHRRVALKLIKGGFATPEMRRRFEQEAQVLGRLQHPGIAQIYEAGNVGTELGSQPYLAMELIAGQPLVDYARGLEVRQKVELIARVCDAVHHAHQRGIIHRDLKPANILVDSQGQSKILDFGIAQMSDADPEATRQTRAGQLVGTFAYMSPEQISGDPYDIDIRSDVYALGVILYELLAGRLPIDIKQKSFLDTVQAIREQEASSLSSVSRMYRGDVETIVAKALEKDKTRRYASASDLASDLRRYLNDEPILARPASTVYQVRKFARRNRTLVAGVAAVFIVLVAGIAASSWESLRARSAEHEARQAQAQATQERDRAVTAEATAKAARDLAVTAENSATTERDHAVAESRRADSEAATARAINDFLQNDLLAQASAIGQAAGGRPDPDIKVRTVLDRAAERLSGKFNSEPKVEASIEFTIGQAYFRLGLFGPAQQHLVQALALDRKALGRNDPATLHAAELLGEAYRSGGKYPEAETLLRETVQVLQRTRKPSDTARVEAEGSLGSVYMAEGKLPEAESVLVEAVKNGAPDEKRTLDAMNVLARLYFVRGRLADAERVLKAIIASYARQFGPDDPRTIGPMNNLAVLYQREARFSDAEATYATVLAAERRALGPEHTETLNVMNNLAVLYVDEGKFREAEPLYAEVLKKWSATLGPEHPRTLSLLSNQAVLLRAEGRLPEAESQLAGVVAARQRVLGREHTDTLDSMRLLAWVYRSEGKYDQAEPLLRQAVETRRRLMGPRNAESILTLAELGELQLEQGKFAEAQKLLQEALDLQMQAKADDYRRYRFESALGASLAGQQHYEQAEPLLISGYQGMKQRLRSVSALNRPYVHEAGERLVRLYESWGKSDKAAEWRKQTDDASQF